MLRLMARLMIILLVTRILCAPVLPCTKLLVKTNKSFGLITQTIKIPHGLYCMVFKNIFFWCDTKSNLAPGLHGGNNKSSCNSDTLMGWLKIYVIIRIHHQSDGECLHVLLIPC